MAESNKPEATGQAGEIPTQNNGSTIDRRTAFGLNPFISDLHTADTLSRCTNSLRTLSLMIATDSGGIDMEPLYTVFDAICIAMEWESEHVTLRSERSAA